MRIENTNPVGQFRHRLAAIGIASALCVASSTPMAAIVDSGPVSLAVPTTTAGLYLNLVTGISNTNPGLVAGWDFNPYGGTTLSFFSPAAIVTAYVGSAGVATALVAGNTIGPANTYVGNAGTTGTTFRTTGTEYVGMRFNNEVTATVNYGYALIQTNAPNGIPVTILRYVYEDTGAAITIPGAPPVFQIALSRKVHGAAGPFDLALSPVPTTPTTEPRQGPNFTLVLTFDKPMVLAGTYAITEGTASYVGGSTAGNELVLDWTAVPDQQYLGMNFNGLQSADGGIAPTVSVRLGFLLGDVNQNRVVAVSDVGLVNAQLAQPVSAANFLKDVNATGTLTVGDKGITNANLAHSLPAP